MKRLSVLFSLVVFLSACSQSAKVADATGKTISGADKPASNTTIVQEPKEASSPKQPQKVVHEKIDTTQAIQFFEDFQQMLLNKDKEALANHTNFPLQGDCVFAYIVGVEEYFRNNEKYREIIIDRKLFIEKSDSIFRDPMYELVKKVDFAKELTDENYEVIKQESKFTHYDLYMYQNRETLILSIGYQDKEESINEHSIHYGFKKFGNKGYKLYKVYCAG